MALTVRKSQVKAPPACPLNVCVKLLGGAWTPHVIWHLSGGPRRFGELRRDISPISAKVLSARLRELERRDIVARKAVKTSPPSVEYVLTPLGQELMPVIQAVVEVGAKISDTSPMQRPGGARARRGAASSARARSQRPARSRTTRATS